MFSFRSSGSFSKTNKFLNSLLDGDHFSDLERYAQMGVNALASATPKDTGETANSWSYTVTRSKGQTTITWSNSKTNNGSRIAIILQYGHGTGTGGYVAGRDYINPAIRPVFDQIATNVWEKVIRG